MTGISLGFSAGEADSSNADLLESLLVGVSPVTLAGHQKDDDIGGHNDEQRRKEEHERVQYGHTRPVGQPTQKNTRYSQSPRQHYTAVETFWNWER